MKKPCPVSITFPLMVPSQPIGNESTAVFVFPNQLIVPVPRASTGNLNGTSVLPFSINGAISELFGSIGLSTPSTMAIGFPIHISISCPIAKIVIFLVDCSQPIVPMICSTTYLITRKLLPPLMIGAVDISADLPSTVYLLWLIVNAKVLLQGFERVGFDSSSSAETSGYSYMRFKLELSAVIL